MFPNSVYELARYISVWFWQDILVCLLALALVVAQFVRNRKTLYVILLPMTFMVVARLIASYHIVTMTFEQAQAGPTTGVKSLWVIYYIFCSVAITAFAFRIKQLWSENSWFNRSLGIVLILVLTVVGFILVYQPYRLLYNLDREQEFSASGRP